MDASMREGIELGNSAEIKVVGVGGGGCNAVNRMIEVGVEGVEFIALNTDAGSLAKSKAPMRMRIGDQVTRGLGCGGDPKVGQKAAEESAEEVQEVLRGADMVFVTAGMGGGTGTGAAAVISQIALELGALTVAVVTKPFSFEGARRMEVAVNGIEQLRGNADTMIVVPNDRLLQILDKGASIREAFLAADDALRQGIQGISNIIRTTGQINVDFQDLRSIMRQGGRTMMAIGRAEGENRAVEAARMAVNSKLLDVSIDGAERVLYNITGPPDMSMREVNEIGDTIQRLVDTDANIIVGVLTDENVGKAVEVTLVATGFDGRPKGAQKGGTNKRDGGPADRTENSPKPPSKPPEINDILDFL